MKPHLYSFSEKNVLRKPMIKLTPQKKSIGVVGQSSHRFLKVCEDYICCVDNSILFTVFPKIC